MNTPTLVASLVMAGVLALLIAVLIPHIGNVVNGARRWISLGPISFQPSELAKIAVLLYAADYMVRKMDVKERFFRAVLPMGVAVGVVGLLLLAQPDIDGGLIGGAALKAPEFLKIIGAAA